MRGGNRVLLAAIGILLIVGGALVAAIAGGLAGPWLSSIGRGGTLPAPSAAILPESLGQPTTTVGALAAVAGLVLVVLGIWWLVAQRPPRAAAGPFRLHADADDGSTLLAPAVINSAVERQLTGLPGIVTANAAVRGAARAPDVVLRVSVDERADIAQILSSINSEVAADLGRALDATVDRLGVLIDVDRKKPTAKAAEL